MSGAGWSILGIDVGTTAVKVALFGADGQPVRTVATGHEMTRRHPSWAEQDPREWWAGCLRGIEEISADGAVGTVRAVGVTSQVNTHVFVDARLRPLLPAITWQDQRCAEIARELNREVAAEHRAEIWGRSYDFDASGLIPRVVWVARNAPEVWRETRWVLSPKDYINALLTGVVASDGMSSIGLVDASGERYLQGAVELVDGLGERLPPLRHATDPLGPVTDSASSRLGAAVAVVGTMDALSEMYACGLTVPGRGMISCGTSLVVAGAAEVSVPTAGIVTFPPSAGVIIHAGPTQAGGDALRWWSRASGSRVARVLADAAAAAPGASGVVFTPHLMGERAPLWDSAVRGSFLGLSTATTGADLGRAVLEGVAMSGRQVLEAVESACGKPLESITFSGGGSKSELWAQIFADVLGRPVQRLATRDYSAVLGAALLGSIGAGIHADLATATAGTTTIDRVFGPDTGTTALLDPLFEVYRDSYRQLREAHSKLETWRSRTPGV
ncbi:FGGY-family carbohydrate kinase [Nocardia sp. NPDC127526]|uniref:xylulokinase n=1 Tax=Nocardia sp. NPDC127526 TaxID=3345393 RepID=UPI00363E0ECB